MKNLRQAKDGLRVHAISQSLFLPVTLKAAIDNLGFVQADPIKAPAPAQDLILRPRVLKYRVGDLDRCYQKLDIEEDMFYAYGFLPREIWRLLHPRDMTGLSKLERGVLEVVRKSGETHPRDLAVHFGNERVINAWGGYSKVTKRVLEDLHYRGLLRISGREKGIRIYNLTEPLAEVYPLNERVKKLAIVVAKILAPVPRKTLQEAVGRLRYALDQIANSRKVIDELLRSGELQSSIVDDIEYVWPPVQSMLPEAVPRVVIFLAPFDPVVWDRRRFEHLWGWAYRFEAYVPAHKRLRGYYAMPLLWGDAVIGWVNANVEGKKLNLEFGYVEKCPREMLFRSELEAEISRFKTFLGL